MSTRPSIHGVRRRVLASAAAVALLTTGLSTAFAADPAATRDGPSSGRYVPAPPIAWRDCPPGWGWGDGVAPPEANVSFSCGTVIVPIDYDQPLGPKAELALRRVAATDQQSKVGTIFLNPGGPGGSGVDFTDVAWSIFPATVRAKFDLVGFDPRGIARSTPLVCFESEQQLIQTLGTTEPFPINPAEQQAISSDLTQFTSLCAKNGSEIKSHMSTANVARDLDVLRRSVGDSSLSYVGYSYGSQLGTTYAHLYPQNVRAMVLDGVLDPVAWSSAGPPPIGIALGSHLGSKATMEQFFVQCVEAGPDACALAAQGDPADIVEKLLSIARTEPIRTEQEGFVMEFTYQTLTSFLTGTMYSPQTWGFSAEMLSELAAATGIASPVAAPAEPPAEPPASQLQAMAGAPMRQLVEGAPGVLCVDREHPDDRDLWWQAGRAADRQAAPFGLQWASVDAPCATWPAEDTDRYTGPWGTKTAKPVLLMNTTFDPATPYPGAQAAMRTLPGSRLVTVEGWGHTTAFQSRCADAIRDRYLLSGTVPTPANSVCDTDTEPFVASDMMPLPPPGEPAPVALSRAQARAMAHQQILANARALLPSP